MSRLWIIVAVVIGLGVGAAGCGKSHALAELVESAGPVERQQGDAAWAKVEVGAKFQLGDAARTAEAGAKLQIIGGPELDMLPHTTLRFGKGGSDRIAVEAGAIELANPSSYGLDVGDVKLGSGARVRITARGAGKTEMELVVGAGTITTLDGHVVELTLSGGLELTEGSSVVTPVVVDAGVKPIDAAVVAVVDAAPAGSDAGSADGVAVDATGRVEVLAAGDKTWKPLGKDVKTLPRGTAVRVGSGTAKLTSDAVTLQLAGGARATVGADLGLALDAGGADASVPVGGSGTVKVPGGGVALAGDAKAAGTARLDVTARDTKVFARGGHIKVNGGGDTALALSPGESAALMHAGDRIQPIEAIPKQADFAVTVGETFTVHDPRPPVAIAFQFGGKCPDGGTVELDRDARFRTAQLSAGADVANLMVAPGGWAYRLRCTQNGVPGAVAASGRVAVIADDGHRPLPPRQPPNPVDADGRTWRISYQSLVPDLQVHYKGPEGGTLKLHLAQGGKDQAFDGAAVVSVAGSQLREGTYTYWFDRDGTRVDKVSTLVIEFDQAAPQVYIELPANAKPFPPQIDVRGAVLPGWSAAVGGLDLPLDKQRRFIASVQAPTTLALAIKLAHPQRGIHYYLRRSKSKASSRPWRGGGSRASSPSRSGPHASPAACCSSTRACRRRPSASSSARS